ncbi:MAG: PilN domain-containing protein [Candidatus Berkiella sp.]
MTTHINLLPWREELKETRKKEFLVLLGSASMVAVLLIVIMHLTIKASINFQMGNNELLRTEIVLLDKKIELIKGLQKEKEKLLARMQIIQELQTNRPHIVRLFDGIARTVPEGLYLTSITRSDTKILLDGKAESNTRVSTFMRNIEAYTWLKRPNLNLIQADEKIEKGKYIGFNLEAVQVVEEPVDHDEPKPQ